MKESIGYSVTINIVITFIIIIFAFLSSAIVYFKSNKASNIIVDAVQKYEGYNSAAEAEIRKKLKDLGYGSHAINCSQTIEGNSDYVAGSKVICTFEPKGAKPNINDGYCVYKCIDNSDYYYYKIRTNMMINIPIVGDMLDIPIYSNTDRIYNFSEKFKIEG